MEYHGTTWEENKKKSNFFIVSNFVILIKFPTFSNSMIFQELIHKIKIQKNFIPWSNLGQLRKKFF